MLREFAPQKHASRHVLSKSDIEGMFSRGDVADAIKACKRETLPLEIFAAPMQAGMRKMLLSHRVNELLSIVFSYGVPCQYDIPTLLKAMHSHGDIVGFLKQAHRFGVYAGFEQQIKDALTWLLDRNQRTTAESYRQKFIALGWRP